MAHSGYKNILLFIANNNVLYIIYPHIINVFVIYHTCIDKF